MHTVRPRIVSFYKYPSTKTTLVHQSIFFLLSCFIVFFFAQVHFNPDIILRCLRINKIKLKTEFVNHWVINMVLQTFSKHPSLQWCLKAKLQIPPLRRRMFALPYKSFWRVVGGLFDNKIMSGNLSHWCRRGIFPEEKMPSEMEVALPYTLFTLQHCLHCFTGYTVYTIQIVLHCLYYSNCLTLLKQEHM